MTVTEVSEEITVTGASSPTVVSVGSSGASVVVSPGGNAGVTSVASDGSVATLEVVESPGPATDVSTPSQVVVQAAGIAIGPEGSDESFVWHQTVATGSALIAHEMGSRLDGGYPQVDVVDDVTMERVFAFGLTFPTADTAQLTFMKPRTFIATFTG